MELRQHILELLWESSCLTVAYELIKVLKLQGSRTVGRLPAVPADPV